MSDTPRPINPLANARKEVRASVRLLEQIRTEFLEQAERLPLPASARDRTELKELSEASELDAALRCAVHDHLDPLLRSLRAVSRMRRSRS